MKNQMKQKEANTTIGYNLCPSCGRPAQAILTNDSTYYIGCSVCGLCHGVSTVLDGEVTQETADMLRVQWNRHTLEAIYDTDALEVLGTNGNGYALVRPSDAHMAFFATEFADIKRFLAADDDEAYDVYLMIDGILQPLGSAYLVRLTIGQ